MSSTLGEVRKSVRYVTQDTDPDDYVHRDRWLNERGLRRATEIGVRAGLGEAWSASALTLNSSTSPPDFSFSASVQYATIKDLRLASSGRLLRRTTFQVIERLRDSDTTSTGEPDLYALVEGATQVVSARIYPRPDATYAVDALISSLPAWTPGSDATVIPFSTLLLAALVDIVAADALEAAPEARADRLASRAAVPGLRASSAASILAEMDRQRRLKASPALVRTTVY